MALALGGMLELLVHRGRRVPVTETVELRFAADVSESAVWGVLGGISGLPTRTQVVLEVVGDASGIRHYLRAEPAVVEMLRSHLRGLLPGLRLEPVVGEEPSGWRAAARLRWGGPHPLLRSDRGAETAAALLGALSGLQAHERVMVRWTLRPARGPHLPARQSRSQAHSQPPLPWHTGERSIDPAHLPALRSKYAGPVLLARATVAVAAGSDGRSVNLLTRAIAVLRARTGLRGQPVVRYARSGRLERFVAGGSFGGGSRFSPAELVGMVGWPIDAPRVPGLVLGVAPQLMPSPRLPRRGGRVLAQATWPGMEGRPLAQPLTGALSHMVVAGPSGVGKSALLASIAGPDIAAGRGCLVLDGKGDLAEEVLRLVPERRQKDVIVLDPGRVGAVPGLRVFGGGDPELAGDLVLGVLRAIFIDSWGVRSDKWLRAGLVTLAYERTATLADLPFLFASDVYRRRLTGRLQDPLLRATWAEFEALSPEARAQQLGSPLNKVNELVGRRVVRSVLAQAEPKWDMREVLRRGQVVIVSLSPGVIGAPASRLLAALVIHELFQAVQARSQVPADKRRPFLVYVDEPRVFTDVNMPLDSLFELARGLGVGLTLSVQSISQLPTELAQAALTNAATLVAFRQNHDDAKLLAHELPGVTPEELQALGRFEVAARIGLGPGEVSAPVTGRTLPPPEPLSDPEEVRATSAARYGSDPQEIDAALLKRHGLDDQATAGLEADETPLRRRRRPAP
ncbi:MAG: type IV secretory system conjugative DNA transfer family protein [Solirubrobacteraceae bacterium]